MVEAPGTSDTKPKGSSYRVIALDGFQMLAGDKKRALVSHKKLTDFVRANLGMGRILRPALLKKTLMALQEEEIIERKKGSYIYHPQVREYFLLLALENESQRYIPSVISHWLTRV